VRGAQWHLFIGSCEMQLIFLRGLLPICHVSFEFVGYILEDPVLLPICPGFSFPFPLRQHIVPAVSLIVPPPTKIGAGGDPYHPPRSEARRFFLTRGCGEGCQEIQRGYTLHISLSLLLLSYSSVTQGSKSARTSHVIR